MGKQEALADVQETLANCSIYTAFSGVVAEVKINQGDNLSNGSTAFVLISNQKVAEITLNERKFRPWL